MQVNAMRGKAMQAVRCKEGSVGMHMVPNGWFGMVLVVDVLQLGEAVARQFQDLFRLLTPSLVKKPQKILYGTSSTLGKSTRESWVGVPRKLLQ